MPIFGRFGTNVRKTRTPEAPELLEPGELAKPMAQSAHLTWLRWWQSQLSRLLESVEPTGPTVYWSRLGQLVELA